MPVPELVTPCALGLAFATSAYSLFVLRGWQLSARYARGLKTDLAKAENDMAGVRYNLKAAHRAASQFREAWKDAEQDLALYRAAEPTRTAEAIHQHCSRIGKQGRAAQLAAREGVGG